ncbi:hypothetical protein [Vibrio rumoiensis]|uniref:Lipoprotein n=1 Tax=Vibrio rumoiensis 1S-45 TaxID=1188252 RepID=A0A1E5E2P7_9VIBR|nr:hypothetical protein [Vibrio rumoiensis]OEF25789.1 hypothetical protein A1QC_08470 [Vibrio rumoiensis 1S-45]
MTKKTLFLVLISGLVLGGCASTGSSSTDTSSSAANSASKATGSESECTAAGMKSYEMANGSIVCY